jgi:predicted RNase H-like HicB family nuclease
MCSKNIENDKILLKCFKSKERKMKLKVVLEPSEEGGYTVHVPSLPGCISEGDTVEEALANIREAIELYLEPVDDDWIIEKGAVVQELVL